MVTFFTRLGPDYLRQKMNGTCVGLDQEGYHGEYEQDYFMLSYDAPYGRHPFKRVFYGTVKPIKGGSIIVGRFAFNPCAGLFVHVWLLMVILFLALSFIKILEQFRFYALLAPLCAGLSAAFLFLWGFVFSYHDEKKVWLFFRQYFEGTYFKKF